MNRQIEQKLLADVLAQDTPADFREALLAQTLQTARRRRNEQHAFRASAVAILLASAVLWLHPNPPVRPASTLVTAAAPYQLVITQPLAADAIITTHHIAFQEFPIAANPVEIVRTSDGLKQITDTQLLALLATHPALLVRDTPHSERLVFVNPDDEKGFPAN